MPSRVWHQSSLPPPACPSSTNPFVLCNARAKPPKCSRDMWYGFFQFFSCGSYNIIKNPLNFNVPYKICALVKASTDNYFWWINQEDKYVWSSCCSIQFLLYTSPAGAITVMFQLVVWRASSSQRSFEGSTNHELSGVFSELVITWKERALCGSCLLLSSLNWRMKDWMNQEE